MLMRAIEEAGLPAGVVNRVMGEGAPVGDEIVGNAATHGIGCMGSAATGKRIAERGAGNPVLRELDGNGPVIVFDDAAVDRAATGRVLAHREIVDKVASRFVAVARDIKLGDPMHQGTTMRPLNNTKVTQKIAEYVDEAVASGARLPTGTGPQRILRRPAEPGTAIADIATPALLVDLAALDRNISRLAGYLKVQAPGVRLRPHAKTHKSPDIAHRQIAAGAIGVCCQTVAEAEAMAAAGVTDILLSNQIADAGKAERLAVIAGVSRLSVCVDDTSQVALLADAAATAGVTIHVLVELDVGGARCGVQSADAAVAMARRVVSAPALAFEGIQAYHGRAQHLRKPSERQTAIAEATRLAAAASAAIGDAGIACRTITGAGTGSFEFEAASSIYTELQCGSYVFMDADYARNEIDDTTNVPRFEQALTVLATVISMPIADRAVCDAGLKAISLDSGPPSLRLYPGLDYAGASDEHSKLTVHLPGALHVGQKIHLVPGHCDPTVAMHDWIIVHDGETVLEVWPVTRGW
jgi:D-serine deaminase-like pyridoxal phosphate-dependent protein